MSQISICHLDDKHIAELIKYNDILPVISKALQEYSDNVVTQPIRTVISVQKHNGYFLSMPSYSQRSDVLATKLLTLYPDNEPSHKSIIVLLRPRNGEILCILDGNLITAMRTAAASTVATQTLVPKTPKVLCILGAGVQARSHLCCLTSVYDFEKISIWNRTKANAENIKRDYKSLPIQVHDNIEDAVCDADVIVTVTSTDTPILKGVWIKEGAHINCVGAPRPTQREVDDDCLKNSCVYADSKEAATKESGDIIQSRCEVYAEIGEVLLGTRKVERKRYTFFKSLGMAVEDAVTAQLVWDKFQEKSK